MIFKTIITFSCTEWMRYVITSGLIRDSENLKAMIGEACKRDSVPYFSWKCKIKYLTPLRRTSSNVIIVMGCFISGFGIFAVCSHFYKYVDTFFDLHSSTVWGMHRA